MRIHPQYHLVTELDPPHLSDVKAVLAIDNNLLASASRDSSVAVWRRSEPGASSFQLRALLKGHDAYVNSLAYIPEGPGAGDGQRGTGLGLLASGGNSCLILLHSLDTLEPGARHCLIGHGLNVCALKYSGSLGKLLSGSWDRTARIWALHQGQWECETVLKGHEQAVWDVEAIGDGPLAGTFLTASADNLIRLWSSSGELVQSFKGSPEPVRSLEILPGHEEFASACNDGIVRIWNLGGSIVAMLKGHSDYVYQVRWCANGHLLSCGEDHTLRVWSSTGDQEAILTHPCATVWTVTSFTDGLIVTGGSDGVLRVWGYDAAGQDTGSQAGGSDAAVEPGLREHSINDTAPGAGVQTDQGSDAGPHEPQEDVQRLVIDIDLVDDEPPLPFIFYSNQDPHEAAVAFGCEHGLSENYVAQIEEFVRSHVK